MLSTFSNLLLNHPDVLLASVILFVGLYWITLRLVNGTQRKGEPPLVTGWIPFIGTFPYFYKDPVKYVFALQKKYGDVFTVYLFGKRVTYITHPLDYQKVYAKVKEISFKELYNGIGVRAFGVSRCVLENENIQKQLSRNFVKNLQTQDAIVALTARMQETLQFHVNKRKQEFSKWKITGLYEFMIDLLGSASLDALFGDNFCNAKVLQNLLEFDETFHLNAAGIPKFLIRKSMKAREGLRSLFSKDYSNASDFVKAIPEILAAETKKEVAAAEVVLVWATQINTFVATFWSIAHLMKQSSQVKAEILNELKDNIEISGSEGVALAPVKCDNLSRMIITDSCINEALRLCAFNINAREATCNFTMQAETGSYKFRKGDEIHIYPAVTHVDDEIYDNPFEFQYDRFLKMEGKEITKRGKVVPRNMILLPFGYGLSQCPGRFFARNEIKLIVAMLMFLFDLKFVNENEPLPEKNPAKFGVGLLPPMKDIQIMIKLKDQFI